MIPDPIERLEAAAERYIAEYYDRHSDPQGESNTVVCSKCGQPKPLGDTWPSSASPVAPPICSACLFVCATCGCELDSVPLDDPGYCWEHCPDHEYVYDHGRAGKFCKHCDAPNPWDYFDE